MNKSDSDVVIGCLVSIVKLILIIVLWGQLDANLAEQWDTAIAMAMLILIL